MDNVTERSLDRVQQEHSQPARAHSAPWEKDWRSHRTPLQARSPNSSGSRRSNAQKSSMSDRATHHSYPHGAPNAAAAPDPSFLSYFGVPIKGAASIDFHQGTIPKNFTQPLTCFYFHTYGQCSKSDDDCLYAHYETGVVASAPVNLDGKKGSIAGRNAIHQLNHQAEREQHLKEWEGMLVAKEMELNGRLAVTKSESKIDAVIEQFYATIACAKAALNDAQCTLTDRREEFAAAMLNISGSDSSEVADRALNALDTAINTTSGLAEGLAVLEKQE